MDSRWESMSSEAVLAVGVRYDCDLKSLILVMFTIGIGVAGLTLGGGKLKLIKARGSNSVIWNHAGFSWLTNLHGLTVDTVVGFEIVLPSGRVLNVDAKQNPDLFWGLKGGLNNFVRHFLVALIPGMITLASSRVW